LNGAPLFLDLLQQQVGPKQRILKLLDLEDARPNCAFVSKRL
jgi:hypothetical protein